jgi:hypothetical protein
MAGAKRSRPPKDKQLLILEDLSSKTEDTRICVNELSTVFGLHRQKTELELHHIKENTGKQAKMVEAHIAADAVTGSDHLALLKQISDQVFETKECFLKLDKKLDLEIQKIEFEIKAVSRLDAQQNDLLDQHMKRTALAEGRLDSLEEPRKWWNQTTQKLTIWLTFVGGAVTFLTALARWMGWI